MARTLVINGADFSENYIEKIVFGEEVPCTGISFDSGSITVDNYEPVDIDYTVTPADTTDTVTFETSDNNVAIIENGKIVAIGIGQCTITAHCGSFSDTATVNVNIKYIAKAMFGYMNNMNNYGYVVNSMNRLVLGADETQKIPFYVLDYTGSGANNLYPIRIPKNATKMRVSRSGAASLFYNTNALFYTFKNESSGDNTYPQTAKYIESETVGNLATGSEYTVTIPEGADAVCVFARTTTTYTDSDDPSVVAGSTLGIDIEFLTE